MPVRDRGPSIPLAEVNAWRKDMRESRAFYNFTADGFNRIHAMAEAVKRYQRMGLL